MPTYTFTRTREQIANIALRKLGALAAGETATADDLVVVYEAIDLRLKEMHQLGKLWHQVAGTTTNVTLSAGVATAAVPADMLFPVTMHLRVGSDDLPVEIIGHVQYQAIVSKSETGEPEKVFVTGSNFTFWPVPDANYTAKLTYQAIAADTAGATAPDVPVSMMRALANVVAYDLRTDFGVSDQRNARIERDYVEAMASIMALNAERVAITTVEMTSY